MLKTVLSTLLKDINMLYLIASVRNTLRDQNNCLLKNKVMQVSVAKEMSLSKITMEYDTDVAVKCSLLKSEFLLGSHIAFHSVPHKFA